MTSENTTITAGGLARPSSVMKKGRVPCVLVVMGVSGCGKSTFARMLSERLECPLVEGDDLHPAANIAKMASGTPLTDADRQPWLEQIGRQVAQWVDARQKGVVTCSSLKHAYRTAISARHELVCFVYLKGSREGIGARLRERTGHFMPASMLDSQFATLEEPRDDEVVLELDASATCEELLDAACAALRALEKEAGAGEGTVVVDCVPAGRAPD